MATLSLSEACSLIKTWISFRVRGRISRRVTPFCTDWRLSFKLICFEQKDQKARSFWEKRIKELFSITINFYGAILFKYKITILLFVILIRFLKKVEQIWTKQKILGRVREPENEYYFPRTKIIFKENSS